MNPKKSPVMSRRSFLSGSAAASTGILLRSLATGIPPALLMAPSKINAQAADVLPQTLIFSTSSRGDPVNVNCPGSYVNGVTNNPHLAVNEGGFGEQRVRAAAPWTGLPRALRRRLAFFHHQTGAAAHPEQDLTMTLRGAARGAAGNGVEMLPSLAAQMNAQHMAYLQSEPFVLSRQKITYENQPLQNAKPSELKALFSGSEDALNDLRPLRDQTLNRLYGHMRNNGTQTQMRFVERFLRGRDQARALGNDLAAQLDAIQPDAEDADGARDQIIAAVALASLQVTPVIVISIPFGQDNHQDADLSREAEETISGAGHIAHLWRELRAANLHNNVTFAMMNVFGRRLYRNGRGGRDHNRHHSVMVAFGRQINGGAYGGLDGEGRCRHIRLNNGRPTNRGGIAPEESLASAGKTLLKAMGHRNQAINQRISAGRILNPFVADA